MLRLTTVETGPLFLSGIILAFGLGALRWQWRMLLVPVGILAALATYVEPNLALSQRLVIWTGASLMGLFRLPLVILHIGWSSWAIFRHDWRNRSPIALLENPPWHWDELIPIPLPFLEELFFLAGREDRVQGLALIEEAVIDC